MSSSRARTWSPEDWDLPGYQDGRKTSVHILSFSRPHMQAFHLAWFAFFICFFTWFSIPAVMPTMSKPRCLEPTSEVLNHSQLKSRSVCIGRQRGIRELNACLKVCKVCQVLFISSQDDMALDADCRVCSPFAGDIDGGCGGLALSQDQVRTSNLLSVAGTILIRVTIGPVADVWGIRLSYCAVLFFFAVPGFMAATVTSYAGLLFVRLLISFIGGSFVLTQLWTSRMFHSNVVGLANAISAGWGNMGGGAALAVLAQIFELCKSRGMTNEESWRATLAWPPALLVVIGIYIYKYGDDCPYGPHTNDSAQKAKSGPSMAESFARAARNWRTWILVSLYAFSFGSELVVSGNVGLYFTQEFRMSQADAALAGSLMGLLNIFARPLGGLISDAMNSRFGTRGRIWPLFIASACMAAMMLAFVSIDPGPRQRQQVVICLGIWAFFSTMTSGTVFALVPFIDRQALGGVAGLVGAGGSIGALIGNLAMVSGYRSGFTVMAGFAALTAAIVPCLSIPGQGSIFKPENRLEEAQGEPLREMRRNTDFTSGERSEP